jgi:hypothetical protein
MRTLVAPGDEFIVEPENADLDVADDDDPAIALRHLGFPRYENFPHGSSLVRAHARVAPFYELALPSTNIIIELRP